MRIIGPICVLICFFGLVSYYWEQLSRESNSYNRRWYLTWLGKGLVFPIVIWILLNVGHTPVMPATVQVMARRNIAPPPTVIYPANANMTYTAPIVIPSPPKWVGVGPVGYVVIQTAPALVGISSFWAALTMGWFLILFIQRAEKQRSFIIGSLIWCGLMLPLSALLCWSYGLGGAGFALVLWFGPILQYLTMLEMEPDPTPHYNRAIVSLKFGKYAEAEEAIIQELEKCENDFDGWMLLAELYARQFNDIVEAEQTIRSLCDDPKTTISQIAVALHKLADWQLQLRGDPQAARRSLEEIVRRMPGTHLATMAKHRIRQLPANHEEWEDQQRGKSLKMPALNDSLDDAPAGKIADANPAEAASAANRYVEKLKKEPNDVEARERLARIFAERMGQAGLALEQMELLLEMPGQPPGKIAEWLGLMAAWQLKYQGNSEAARKLLQRLIREFPQSAQAFAAQRRLTLIERERSRKTA